MVNAISVDVEEYFHATNLKHVAPAGKWRTLPSRAEASTHKALRLFSDAGVRGTFFVLDCVARRFPGLVREIAAQGHEVASHGYAHQLAYEQTPRAFYRDVRRTKLLLEDLCSTPVCGFRAPSFSITSKNRWAYDELVRAGYAYDSSLYPVPHPRYSNAARSRAPERVECRNGSLNILPVAVAGVGLLGRELRLPVAGGGYWRHFPRRLIIAGLRRINDKEGMPFVCYFHPWELDTEQPVFHSLPLLTRWRHYGGIAGMPATVTQILKEFHFGPVRDLLKTDISDKEPAAYA